MLRLILSLMMLLVSGLAQAQVVLTEIMFNPLGPEATDEFIEIVNLSKTDTVSLDGWRVGDQLTQEPLAFPDSVSLLLPGQYAVIFDRDYFSSSNSYDDLLPPSALRLSVADNTLGSGGLSNSRGETILLLNADGDTVAQYTYSPDNPPGHSDEKVDIAGPDTPENWRNSLVLLGTPGFRNSVSPRRFDVALSAADPFLQPAAPRVGDTLHFSVKVENVGTEGTPVLYLRAAVDDTLFVDERAVEPLESGEIRVLSWQWVARAPGFLSLHLELLWHQDEYPADNILERTIAVAWPKHAVVLNEIYFNPRPAQSEWVELLNVWTNPVPLAGWRLIDASGQTATVPMETGLSLNPTGFALLSSNRSVEDDWQLPENTPLIDVLPFPTLNNQEETLVLLDATGAIIDSLTYDGRGIPRGVSLERVREDRPSTDMDNWQACRDSSGATPGRRNSVSPFYRDAALTAQELQWLPTRPGREELITFSLSVRNVGREPIPVQRLALGVDANRDGVLAEAEVVSQKELEETLQSDANVRVSLTWTPLVSGLYALILSLQAVGDEQPENNSLRFELPVGYRFGDVVINEIFPAPLDDSVEWLELFNRSRVPVALWHWRLADSRTVSAPIDTMVYLAAGGLMLLAAAAIPELPEVTVVQLKHWPSLNNDGDRLVLLDFYDNVIDSLTYSFPAGTTAGVSLERVNPDIPASAPGNWHPSADAGGATPGRTNSIFAASVPAEGRLTVQPNPFSPDGDGFEDYTIIAVDLPMTASRMNLEVYDLRGRRVRRILNNAPSGAHRQVIWDGRADDGRTVEMGIYIIAVQALADAVGRLERAYATVIVAHR